MSSSPSDILASESLSNVTLVNKTQPGNDDDDDTVDSDDNDDDRVVIDTESIKEGEDVVFVDASSTETTTTTKHNEQDSDSSATEADGPSPQSDGGAVDSSSFSSTENDTSSTIDTTKGNDDQQDDDDPTTDNDDNELLSSSSDSATTPSSSSAIPTSTNPPTTTTTSTTSARPDTTPNLGYIHKKQVENYKAGKALIKLIHITHHGGTFFCGQMKKWGPVPKFACMLGSQEQEHVVPFNESVALWDMLRDEPWMSDTTDVVIPILREHYHFLSSEWSGHSVVDHNNNMFESHHHHSGKRHRKHHYMSDLNYENEQLVSVYITKHPLDRALSGDGYVKQNYPPEENRTSHDWWKWANDDRITNNYALSSLSDVSHCCSSYDDGSSTNNTNLLQQALINAKKLLKRFTIIMDSNCLSQSMRAFQKLMLGQQTFWVPNPTHIHPPILERLGNNDTLYKYLLKRNQFDIQMHEYAKSRSIINCDELSDDENGNHAIPYINGVVDDDENEDDDRDSPEQVNRPPPKNDDDGKLDFLHMEQIRRYREGRALMKLVRITNHAGKYFCKLMKKWGPTPASPNCMIGKEEREKLAPFKDSLALYDMIRNEPWTNGTTAVVPIIREHFHFIATKEFGGGGSIISHTKQSSGSKSAAATTTTTTTTTEEQQYMYDTNWESDYLVSIYITRDPLDRALTDDDDDDMITKNNYPPENERTSDDWWRFANEPILSNNFALAALSDTGRCCNGAKTKANALENAKKLLRRFTIVLDATCLLQSLRKLAELMGEQYVPVDDDDDLLSTHRLSVRERLDNDTLHEYLLERNKLDIQMHKFAQSLSLVKCEEAMEGPSPH